MNDSFAALFVESLLAVILLAARGSACADEPSHAGMSLGQWLKRLENDDPRERLKAIEAVTAIGPEPLLKRLNENMGPERPHTAAMAIGMMSPPPRTALPALIDALRLRRNQGGRPNPAWAITFAIASNGPDVVPDLLEL